MSKVLLCRPSYDGERRNLSPDGHRLYYDGPVDPSLARRHWPMHWTGLRRLATALEPEEALMLIMLHEDTDGSEGYWMESA